MIPLVSVCLITYNHEKTIGLAIESILNQKTECSFELVIGDDGSTDETPGIVSYYAHRYPTIIRALLSKKNRGMHENSIETYSACKGQYVAFLNGDDYWINPNKIQLQINAMKANPSVTLCGTNALSFDEVTTQSQIIHPNHPIAYITDVNAIVDQNFFHTCTMMVKRDELSNIPETLQSVWGDWAFKFFYALQGDILFLPQITGVYRVTGNGVWSSMNKLEQLRTILQVLRGFVRYAESKRLVIPGLSFHIQEQLKAVANECINIGDTLGKQSALEELATFPESDVRPTIHRKAAVIL